MTDFYRPGEFFIAPNGTIFRITDEHYPWGKVKLRCIRPCSGRESHKDRIGYPYTYQRWSNIKFLKKCKRIGTEQILHYLFEANKVGDFNNE